MKLYNSIGPNPRMVRMFAAEKGLSLSMVEIDLMGGENRQPDYAGGVNVAGQTPALALDDGQVISEITVICEYLEEKHPTPALIGSTPETFTIVFGAEALLFLVAASMAMRGSVAHPTLRQAPA